MLAGVLLKQVAIAIVLSVLLYCYSLIMGTADAVLPWALKILMIALVTVAVFIYRKPFTHLFSAVGYGTLGSAERAEYSLREAGSHLPPQHRRRRHRRRPRDSGSPGGPVGPAQPRPGHRRRRRLAGVAGGAAAAAAAAAGSGEAAAGNGTGTGQAAAGDAYAARLRPDAPPAADGDDQTSPAASRGVAAAGLARAKNSPETGTGTGRTPPPLDLPPRNGTRHRHGGSRPAAGRPAAGRPAAGRPAPPPAGPAARDARRRRPGPRPHGPAPRPAAPRAPGPPGQCRPPTGQPGRAPATGRPHVKAPRPGRCPAGQAAAPPRAHGSGQRLGPGWPSTGLRSHRAVPAPEPAAPKNLGPCRSGCARYGASNRQAPWSSAPASAAWPSPPSSSCSPRSATTWWSRP